MISKLKIKLLWNLLIFIVVYISGLWVLYLLYSLPINYGGPSRRSFLRKHRYIFFSTPWIYSKEFKIRD